MEVPDQIRHKPSCTTTQDGYRPKISDLDSREIKLSGQLETKALISLSSRAGELHRCFSDMQKSWFSHDAA